MNIVLISRENMVWFHLIKTEQETLMEIDILCV